MSWLDANRAYVLDMLVQHVRLSVPAVVISVLVAVVLGRIAWRWPRAGTVVLGTASLLYSVPALPLVGNRVSCGVWVISRSPRCG